MIDRIPHNVSLHPPFTYLLLCDPLYQTNYRIQIFLGLRKDTILLPPSNPRNYGELDLHSQKAEN